jgi:hypothetical protein
MSTFHSNIISIYGEKGKGFLMDTLLLCHLLDVRLEDMRERRPELYGHVLENFVATERITLLSFSSVRAKLLHCCTSNDKAVDFVLKRPARRRKR